ncbi:MAG: aspartate--tRNA(Asn) ligase, partial [Candidatus Aenigmarchaeota archaeon]|nr:aspartate--tRNA(Asn) ligase [Candidatus Aenigmarchaeota archaeon]
MERTYSHEVKPGKQYLLKGWVSQIRDLGKLKFFLLRDREGFVQVTLKKGAAHDDLIAFVSTLGREDCVAVLGEAKEAKQAPNGVEIFPERIDMINRAKQLPIEIGEKIETNLDKRLDWRSLDLRSPKNTAIFKIQSALVAGMEEYLGRERFLHTFTPCMMGTPSESGADVFPVFYYNKEVYLRQDPQLHRELLILAGFDKIFDLGPSWRAEASHTTRHLSEHRGMAPEMAFIEDERDIIKLEENVVIAALQSVKKNCSNELELWDKKIAIPERPFPELRFPEVYDILEKLGKKIPFGEDYDRESEQLLSEWVKKKYKSEFYFVNRFPFAAKPFYVMRADDDPRWARSIDLVYKGLEQSSGGQREHRYEK